MPENQTFDEVEILDHVLAVSHDNGFLNFRIFWRNDIILDFQTLDIDEGITELQNAFFGLEFDLYGKKDREYASKEFFRVIRTRWRWLHN